VRLGSADKDLWCVNEKKAKSKTIKNLSIKAIRVFKGW